MFKMYSIYLACSYGLVSELAWHVVSIERAVADGSWSGDDRQFKCQLTDNSLGTMCSVWQTGRLAF